MPLLRRAVTHLVTGDIRGYTSFVVTLTPKVRPFVSSLRALRSSHLSIFSLRQMPQIPGKSYTSVQRTQTDQAGVYREYYTSLYGCSPLSGDC
jgi:hypothetical protein